MKKTYSKPTAELIDFSLTASVAGACSEYLEYLEMKDYGYFADTTSGCSIPTTCYHVPTDALVTFAS